MALRPFAGYLLALFAVVGCNTPAPRRTDARPNLVVILTDDQEMASLASMRRTRELLAAGGATFAQYVVPISLCCPSRATILTGLYPHNHRVLGNFAPDGGFFRFQQRGLEDSTLAVALHAAGYRTALLGKYLNGYPNAGDSLHVPAGWDEWASPVGGSPYGQYRYTLNVNGALERHGDGAKDYLTDVIAERALAFVKRAGKEDRPFFLLASVYPPHLPATPAARHVELFRGDSAPRTPSFDEADVTDKPSRIQALPPLRPAVRRIMDATWRRRLQSLQAVDELVDRLAQELSRQGQLDGTYFVFTSDNGFHFGQHRMPVGKYTAYESDVHVPLLVRGPGVAAGRVIEELASSVDLAPTLAEMAGVSLPLAADGRSLLPVLRGTAAAAWRRVQLLEQFDFPPGEHPVRGTLEPSDPQDTLAAMAYPPHTALRTATTKYVEYADGAREVYDLTTDPDETTNLARSVSKAWLAQAARQVKALSACRGDACRRSEEAPLPVPPVSRPD